MSDFNHSPLAPTETTTMLETTTSGQLEYFSRQAAGRTFAEPWVLRMLTTIQSSIKQMQASLAPLAALWLESKRGPTIGRKRRQRRARGRARAIAKNAKNH